MLKKQHIICFLLAVSLILSLTGCGKGKDASTSSGTENAAADAGTENSEASTENAANTSNQPSGSMSVEPALSGKIEFIELGDRDPSVLKGLRIIGNSVGSADDINGKASSLTDVRCIFEFYEWIEFYPDMNPECELSVYVIEHREDQEFYNDCKFSEDMPGFVSICDLRYPTDADNPAEWYWGTLYLSPDENAAGFYDFVFVYEGKAIATLLTRFYNETELSDRSSVELEELMHGK